ncbi:MAG: AMP-binding protein [Candidatus Eremiobacteraeota bacterium]|nr:AMP-binding protein [Candidatus Eremiobacteraeota bacterium]
MLLDAPTAVHLRRLSPLDFLERSAAVYRERVAVVDGDARWTYPEMLERVYRFAHVLAALGVVKGDRVAVLCKNESTLLEAHFAVPAAGAILCALNIRLVKNEIEYIAGHCGATVVVYDAEFAPLVADLPTPVVRISVDDLAALIAHASSERFDNPASDEDETISINYTSGTTGQPKGVMYTHRGAYQNALAEIFHAGLRPESVYLWTLPMFHCNGWCFPWAVTAAGATHVCLPKVDPERIFALIEREGVTHFCGAPTVLIGLANHPGAKPFARPVSVTTAGAPPAPTTIAQMEALGAVITHVYGLTETYGPVTVCAWQPQWDTLEPAERARMKARQGVGMLTVGPDDVRVVRNEPAADGSLVDVPRDGATQGEIVMRGNNVMKGYYDDPAATARAFAGGYFHSGDIAVWHADGYLEIQDRAKDVIISGGENISTVQVEKAILEHAAVLECAVVAKPDDKWGEVPKAFVTLKPGASLGEDELIAHCRERLPGYKTPKAVEFGDLPKTSTGKIQKFVLREREWQDKGKRVN